MYVCMYVCIYACMYVGMYLHVCIYMQTFGYIYIYCSSAARVRPNLRDRGLSIANPWYMSPYLVDGYTRMPIYR